MDDQRSATDRTRDEAPEESLPAIIDNGPAHRFELTVDGHTAFLIYERTDKVLRLIHTEVPPPLRHRHLGEALVKATLDRADAAGLRVVAVCPFVQAYLRKHPRARAERVVDPPVARTE